MKLVRITLGLWLATVIVAHATFPSGRVSLDLKDADVRDVLWAFAKEHRMNVLLGEDVKGTVTVTLQGVSIQSAFLSILDSAGLGYTQSANILRVNTLQKIKGQQEVEPLVSRVVHLNYFTTRFGMETLASEGSSQDENDRDDLLQLRDALEEHLSGKAGSSVTLVSRTNSLVITDISSNVDRLVSMARSLDTPAPQVVIESRIVEVNADYSRALGITTSLRGERTKNTRLGGGLTGDFPPAGIAGLGSGAMDFFLESIGGKSLVDLQIILEAAEEEGYARTLATPRVTTLNNKEAVISSGQRIPFTTIGSIEAQGGTNLVATVQFVDAALELAVTPHVTHDGKVILKVRTSRNTADFSRTVFQNPTIQTREARNEVLVDDGATVVIGGIYIQDQFETEGGLPFFKDIPVFGHLFRNELRDKETQELIFLIRPHVLSHVGTAASGATTRGAAGRPDIQSLSRHLLRNREAGSGQ